MRTAMTFVPALVASFLLVPVAAYRAKVLLDEDVANINGGVDQQHEPEETWRDMNAENTSHVAKSVRALESVGAEDPARRMHLTPEAWKEDMGREQKAKKIGEVLKSADASESDDSEDVDWPPFADETDADVDVPEAEPNHPEPPRSADASESDGSEDEGSGLSVGAPVTVNKKPWIDDFGEEGADSSLHAQSQRLGNVQDEVDPPPADETDADVDVPEADPNHPEPPRSIQHVEEDVDQGSLHPPKVDEQMRTDERGVPTEKDLHKEEDEDAHVASTLAVEPLVNNQDATKPDFVMPSFDELARVRLPRLQQLSLLQEIATEVIKVYSQDKRGVKHSTWVDNHVESKIRAFLAMVGAVGKGSIDFAQFSTLTMDPIELTDAGVMDSTTPTKMSKSDIAKWLSKKGRDYWANFGGAKLAKSFLRVQKCGDWQQNLAECPHWLQLLQFIQLDKDRSGEVGFEEMAMHGNLPTDLENPPMAWESVAVVGQEDIATLKFPTLLSNSIWKTVKNKESISRAEWNDLSLQSAIGEFVKRDYRPSYKGKVEKFTGELRFFQIADVLPSSPASGDFMHGIKGFETKIHVPTLDEVAGGKGRLEVTQEEIEAWLQKEEQAMKNKWYQRAGLGSDKWAHAKKMARDIMRWGNGTIPDLPARGADNGRLQGPAAGSKDQFSDVAPRIAVFVHLDSDHDGKIDFQAAYPYLKAA